MEIESRRQFGELLQACGLIKYAACEVGVAEGRYSREILRWGVPLLYLVDLWQHVDGRVAELGGWSDTDHESKLQTCVENLSGLEARYELLRGWSNEMAAHIPDCTLGFCYIDATHTRNEVTADLIAYWPKVAPGGIMAGHDYLSAVWPEVQWAVRDFAKSCGVAVHAVPENNANDSSFWMVKT